MIRIFIFFLIISANAHADWASYGVLPYCNKKDGIFELFVDSVDSTETYGWSSQMIDEHFEKLREKGAIFDGSHSALCEINGNKINVGISITPARPRGECAGANWAHIDYLRINDKPLVENEFFESGYCWGRITELKLIVTNNDYTLYACREKDSEGTQDTKEECEETHGKLR